MRSMFGLSFEEVESDRFSTSSEADIAGFEESCTRRVREALSERTGDVDSPCGFVEPPKGIGVPHADRARIFKPFAALRGYCDLVHEQERVETPKIELEEEEARQLSEALSNVRKGDMLHVTYYDQGAYLETTACVRQVDATCRCLVLVSRSIPFDSLFQVRVVSSSREK